MSGSSPKPKILLFEWLVGGGLLVEDLPLNHSCPLFHQGFAMRQAIGEDFLAAGCELVLPTDRRCVGLSSTGPEVGIDSGSELPNLLRRLGGEVDFLFLIAPESAGRLQQVLEWCEPHRARLLSPGVEWVRLFSDKQASCDWLRQVGIRVPAGRGWRSGCDAWPPAGIELPVVIKPNDGCAGEGLQVVEQSWDHAVIPSDGSWRVESLVRGESVSVMALTGGGQHLLLQPTRQRFAAGRLGDYVGGEILLESKAVAAIWAAAERALVEMDGICGMIGFDLVLERLPGKPAPRVTMIEVNPRLTSSYLGLRKYYAGNLAGCLLSLMRGEKPGSLPLHAGRQAHLWQLD